MCLFFTLIVHTKLVDIAKRIIYLHSVPHHFTSPQYLNTILCILRIAYNCNNYFKIELYCVFYVHLFCFDFVGKGF